MQKNRILAVWGNPSSGKTLVSSKIAVMLSKRKKDVILVYSDPFTPVIPVVLPGRDSAVKSIGRILAAPEITQDIIYQNCLTLKKNAYLAFVGYQWGEGVFTYPACTKSNAMDFVMQLGHIADYAIIDCCSLITENILTAIALEMSDAVVRLQTCDLKSISYFATQLPYLTDRKFNSSGHISVLSNFKPNQPINEMKDYYGGVRFELPYTVELDEQYSSASILDDFMTKQGKKFESSLKAIVEEVFDG